MQSAGMLTVAIAGPLNRYHQYCGERDVLEMKGDVNSGSSPNENLSNNIAEKDRMKLMPFLVRGLGPGFAALGLADNTKNLVYYDVANELKYESSS